MPDQRTSEPTYRVLEAASVLLFFIQALRVIFSVMFGIIYDQVFEGPMDLWLVVSNLLVVAALIAPALAPRQPGRFWPFMFASLAAAGRVGLSINIASVRYWTALVVIAASGLYFAVLLMQDRYVSLYGLLAALGLDQLLRAVGDTYDLSLRPGWLPVQIGWAILIVWLAVRLSRREQLATGEPGTAGNALSGLGLGGALFLEISLLALPNAVAGWSGWSYMVLAPALLGITALILLPGFRRGVMMVLFERFSLRFGALVLLAATSMIGYFSKGEISALALLVSHLLVLGGLSHLLSKSGGEGGRPGPWLAIGLLFFLALNFFNAFAFTYPYVLPVMRGLGWVVYLAAALALGFGTLLHRYTGELIQDRVAIARRVETAWAIAGGALGVALVLAAVWPRPPASLPQDGRLRVATYNIHYGYDTDWRLSLEDIARTIEANGAHVVALQEVDRGRLTSYALDNAYYLARRLRMQVAYLPTIEHLTGIAVLYAGTAAQVDTRLLTSLQEQTGVVRVLLETGGRHLNAYGIWLGLSDEETLAQIQEALEFIGATNPATFGGDFNAEPDSPEVGAIRKAGFVDPFLELGFYPPPPTDPAIQPRKQIDYVWLRNVTPVKAWVPESLASDHRMVVVEIQLGP